MIADEQVQVLRGRFELVMEQIETTAVRAGRNPNEIRLVVVTKGHPVTAVMAAWQSGMRIFGENYPEEGAEKIEAMLAAGFPAEWHMIGHIQSRKADLVAQSYDWIHSVDRMKTARRLDRFASEAGRKLPYLLECNVSGEETKYGWPAWDEAGRAALPDAIRELAELENLELRGLMTMAPFFDTPEPARPYFERLRCLRDFLSERLGLALPELSMGMSGDFTAAIQEGATLVRIGTAIMGPRPSV